MEAAFFDLDGTILNLATEKIFCRELYRQGVVSASDLLRVSLIYLKYEMGFVRGYSDVKRGLIMAMVKDLQVPDIALKATRFLDDHIKPRISKPAVAEINFHRNAGRPVYVISSTLDCLVDPVVDFLGTGERFATRLEVEKGLYTGRVVGDVVSGPKKAAVVKELAASRGIDLKKSYAYGDSIQDADMLRCVGNPCAVNPDRKMAQIATKNGWRIINWK